MAVNRAFDDVVEHYDQRIVKALPRYEDLFSTIYKQLRIPGIFINIDQIRAPTKTMEQMYWFRWLDDVRQNNADEKQLSASIKRRKQYDRDATLVDQLRWLSEAGFTDVDCLYKHFFTGVFCAMKRAAIN